MPEAVSDDVFKPSTEFVQIDVHKLYQAPDWRKHHLSQADGFNEKLVLEQTHHRKFAMKVREAKEKLEPLFELGVGRIVIGVNCNGGKQRSVAFSRMLGAFLSRSAWVEIKHMQRKRWCGCSHCQGDDEDTFALALSRFGHFCRGY